MTVATTAVAARGSATKAARQSLVMTAMTVVALYCLGLVAQLAALALIRWPLTEGSSYYVAVAHNLLGGRGLTIDAIWSYATPPLTLPRPAFELWQPMASFIAAPPMALLGPSYAAAQLGFAFLGAALAPLAWLVARDGARRLDLDQRRATTVALGAGGLTALSTPLLLAGAAPDSTLPFAVVGVVACLLMPAAMNGERRALAGLGIALGLAYLTRMEAVWLGLAFVVGSAGLARTALRVALTRATAVAALAALVAAPWWVRNLAVFGTPLPGQLTDNLFLTRNEQIFAYLDRPTLDGFLAQGLPTIVTNVAVGLGHDAWDVLVVAGGPLAAAGLLTLVVAIARRRGLPAQGALAMLLLSGAITFVATSVLFPVATLWGTFEHAAGPLQVGLVVAAVIGMDAFVARVRAGRNWPRSNSWLAPAALALVAAPLCAVALTGAAASARADAERVRQVALPAVLRAGQPLWPWWPVPLISDRPIWLSDALDQAVIALPDEPPQNIAALAAEFHASFVVVTEPRNDMPAALRTEAAAECFAELPFTGLPAGSAVFQVNEACR